MYNRQREIAEGDRAAKQAAGMRLQERYGEMQYNTIKVEAKSSLEYARLVTYFSGQHRGDRYKADPSADPAVSGRRLCDDV